MKHRPTRCAGGAAATGNGAVGALATRGRISYSSAGLLLLHAPANSEGKVPEKKETKGEPGCCGLLLIVAAVILLWHAFAWAWSAAHLSLRYPWIIGLTVALCNILAAIGFLGFAADLRNSTFWKIVFVMASLGLLAGSVAAYALRPSTPARVFLQCYLVGLFVLYVGGALVARRIREHHERQELERLRELVTPPRDQT
jgi:lysylphosphatidylglycerol synthetase-like protein (DUF2156 family)